MDVFRDLPLFVEVARTRSFRQAAENLRMPGSTVSRRIAELERAIGLRLFHRTTRRVELTEGGQRYFERCRRILAEARLAHEELTTLQTRPSGLIRVALPVDFAVVFLSGILAEFARQYPEIRFQLDLSPRRVDLLSEPLDVAIRMGNPPDSTLVARRLAVLRTGLFAAPAYLSGRGTPAHPDELPAHEALRYDHAPWRLVERSTGAIREIAVDGRFLVNNVGMARRLALEGLGIALLAEGLVRADLDNGGLRPLLCDWDSAPVPVFALTETRLIPAKVRVFLDFLAARLDTAARP